MVLLLNYLPWIIVLIGIFLFWKAINLPVDHPRRKRYVGAVILGTVLSIITLNGLTAGYIPKQRSSEVKIGLPAFEASQAEIQDRLRKPERLGEESEARFNEKTDWRQHLRDEEAKAKAAQEASKE